MQSAYYQIDEPSQDEIEAMLAADPGPARCDTCGDKATRNVWGFGICERESCKMSLIDSLDIELARSRPLRRRHDNQPCPSEYRRFTAEFPKSAIKYRKGGGNASYAYVEGFTIIRRLNEATCNCWDHKVLNLDFRADMVLATVEITIPGLGSRQHIGMVETRQNGGLGDLVKGAVTDALKKAATLFGVGLDLRSRLRSRRSRASDSTRRSQHRRDHASPRLAPKRGYVPTAEERQ